MVVIALYVALVAGNVVHVGHAADEADHSLSRLVNATAGLEHAAHLRLSQRTAADGPMCHTLGALRALGRPSMTLASAPAGVGTLTKLPSSRACVPIFERDPQPLSRRLAMLQILQT
jgi:hypothetical protein